jgi:hypothetical protein
MALKPWYKVVTPREDLRDGKPLDASEFAVHLDQVRDGRAPAVYQDPERFLERTFLTKGLALACGKALSVHPKTELNRSLSDSSSTSEKNGKPPGWL